jgi:hypothetical protein
MQGVSAPAETRDVHRFIKGDGDHALSIRDDFDRPKSQTSTATPAEPGELSISLDSPISSELTPANLRVDGESLHAIARLP